MKTNEKFTELLNTPGVKFTIILGSGFHRNAIGGDSIDFKKFKLDVQ